MISFIQEEWRINMLPIDFLFLTVRPVIDMRLRCKSQGVEYPPEVPLHITKFIELEIVSKLRRRNMLSWFNHWFPCASSFCDEMTITMQIRWELQGLDDVLKPSHFSLGVKGVLYSDRQGPRSRLKGRLQMSISFILPSVLSLVPEEVRREVAEMVIS